MKLDRNHSPGLGLRQYRGQGWPLLGSFAFGVLTEPPGGWGVDVDHDDTLTEVSIQTPLGSIYTWYRDW